MTRKASLLSVGFILLLIVYDTLQQKYYVDTFLSPEVDYALLDLLKRHSQSWLGWIVVGFPFSLMFNRLIKHNSGEFSVVAVFKLISVTIVHITLTLVVITVVRLTVSNLEMNQFPEFFIFHMFQKGLVFFMADCTVIVLLYIKAKNFIIQSQYVEIKDLEKNNAEQFENRGVSTLKAPQMVIKTGKKIDQVSLEDIVWIQADDYCSKIHTNAERSFTLRKSLKSLENDLRAYGFIRIHRGALLNLNAVNQVNLDKSVVLLKNDIELPVSKSRVKGLRESLLQSSI